MTLKIGVVLILGMLLAACGPPADEYNPESPKYWRTVQANAKEAFRHRCEEVLGGIVVQRAVDNWFSGARFWDDCALPKADK